MFQTKADTFLAIVEIKNHYLEAADQQQLFTMDALLDFLAAHPGLVLPP